MHPIFQEQEKEFERIQTGLQELSEYGHKMNKDFLHLSNLAIAEKILKMVEGKMPKKFTKENCPISKMQLETMGLEHTQGFVEGHNSCLANFTTAIEVIRKEINER